MTNFESTDKINIEGKEIEKVDQYKYLGQTIVMEDRTANEVQLRIKAGWSVFGRQATKKGDTYVLEKKSIQSTHKPNTDLWLPNMDTNKITRP